MCVVDLCFFVAEHDDHHLRAMDELRSAFAITEQSAERHLLEDFTPRWRRIPRLN